MIQIKMLVLLNALTPKAVSQETCSQMLQGCNPECSAYNVTANDQDPYFSCNVCTAGLTNGGSNSDTRCQA